MKNNNDDEENKKEWKRVEETEGGMFEVLASKQRAWKLLSFFKRETTTLMLSTCIRFLSLLPRVDHVIMQDCLLIDFSKMAINASSCQDIIQVIISDNEISQQRKASSRRKPSEYSMMNLWWRWISLPIQAYVVTSTINTLSWEGNATVRLLLSHKEGPIVLLPGHLTLLTTVIIVVIVLQ